MTNQKEQRLDVFSKIILVTGSINYNALQINNNLQCARIIQAVSKNADSIAVVEQMENNDNKQLNETLKKLSAVLEELGDYMNNCDMTQPIDERVTTPVFKIIHGEDLIES